MLYAINLNVIRGMEHCDIYVENVWMILHYQCFMALWVSFSSY